jgi:tetratricopeptide (TPR) repeat protein
VKTSPRQSTRVSRALLASVLLLAATTAFAQVGRRDPDAIRAHKQKTGQADDKASTEKFPNATRTSPETQATKAGGKALNAIVELYEAKQYPQAIEKVDALASDSTNAYERSFAYQLAATAAAELGEKDKAAAYYQKALDTNGLSNDEHYQVMYNLAVTQLQTKHPEQALATLDRLVAETKSDAPEYAPLRAALLADLKRPEEAAALYEKQFNADPSNGKALMNAAAAYQQAGNFAKANALLSAAHDKGLLTDASQYRALYVGYINDGKPKQAVAIIDEGLAKGILQPDADLAKGYAVIAQNAYTDGDSATAIAMYQRAVPIAADGESALNLARVFFNEGRMPEARKAAQQALEKGVKNPAAAKKIADAKDR